MRDVSWPETGLHRQIPVLIWRLLISLTLLWLYSLEVVNRACGLIFTNVSLAHICCGNKEKCCLCGCSLVRWIRYIGLAIVASVCHGTIRDSAVVQHATNVHRNCMQSLHQCSRSRDQMLEKQWETIEKRGCNFIDRCNQHLNRL